MDKCEAIKNIESLSSGLKPKSATERAESADNPTKARQLLHAFGDPQKHLKFIHVCGSNGKGSVCAMLESVLREAGYKTGLFTSPHVADFCERIRVDGRMIGGDELGSLTERLMPSALSMPDPPGYFCFLTVLAILYFFEQNCDLVILETGIGGLKDSTNVIDAPELAVVTRIGYEHTAILGNSLTEIAGEKAGIIKEGCECVALDSAPEVTAVLRQTCRDKGVPLSLVPLSSEPVRHACALPVSQTVKDGNSSYELALLGPFQQNNAALALRALHLLNEHGYRIGESAIRRGFADVTWPARFEVLRADPPLILDGGHNPQCAEALAESLNYYLPGEKITFIIGVMNDKNADGIIQILRPLADRFICVRPDPERGLDPACLAEIIRTQDTEAVVADGCANALSIAESTADGRPIVIFGSLYLAGQMKHLL